VELADESGSLGIGGDLTPERLLHAYEHGIFPWFSEDEPILWWSPDPRFVLFPSELKVSRTMRQVLKRNYFHISIDQAFKDVIAQCSEPRMGQPGTWITDDMKDAYQKLHELGYAHSVEAWLDGDLVGGLYGISLGSYFFGESMFTRVSNASKAAFITLVQKLYENNFTLIDCQVHTDHLASLGASHIERSQFIDIIENPAFETIQGNWGEMESFSFL
jgi:leucyl/phenylalanyl-tRNA--protein transferase